MRFVFFCHSILSDWNHGNAHFLRGVIADLLARRHEVRVFEPVDGWSFANLMCDHRPAAARRLHATYPWLKSYRYDERRLDLDAALDGADVVVVHEWSSPQLVARIGAYRARTRDFALFFHDTHHRAATAPHQMRSYDLRSYDGVLAFGRVIRDAYLEQGWAERAWTWHEAADVRSFGPRAPRDEGDVVWIGNWGDGERTAELKTFLLDPVAELGVRGLVHGVRYPRAGRAALARAGMTYRGWLPSYEVPEVFAGYRMTVHVPRRPYVEALPGVPTIRVFEALACGIPLVSAPWPDLDELFTPGEDFLVARDGAEMRRHIRAILSDRRGAEALARRGRQTILERHTCAHRVDELLSICRERGVDTTRPSLAQETGS